MEFKNLDPLIRQDQSGVSNAMFELFLEFEPSIIKHSRRYTSQITEDCYQELATQFIVTVQPFDLNKYTIDSCFYLINMKSEHPRNLTSTFLNHVFCHLSKSYSYS
ncbi:helix-turn-helix domain-containing protein [Enterococcus sp. UD-01]|jgi:hypothetical protein|uniref:helix-turn-helix domain-containing protein n=1 Tax=Enterococcus sp. UD-01 TaxID=3373911 RepID=UPI00383405ED